MKQAWEKLLRIAAAKGSTCQTYSTLTHTRTHTYPDTKVCICTRDLGRGPVPVTSWHAGLVPVPVPIPMALCPYLYPWSQAQVNILEIIFTLQIKWVRRLLYSPFFVCLVCLFLFLYFVVCFYVCAAYNFFHYVLFMRVKSFEI